MSRLSPAGSGRNQPHPAATKVAHGSRPEGFCEVRRLPKSASNSIGQATAWLPPPFWRHGIPIESVVPGLSGVVEERRSSLLANRNRHDVIQRSLDKNRASDKKLGFLHIGAMVLAVWIPSVAALIRGPGCSWHREAWATRSTSSSPSSYRGTQRHGGYAPNTGWKSQIDTPA